MANRLPALQQGEQAERDRLEGVVQTHLTNATEQLVAARLALLSIRDQRLYKSTHRSFGDYCLDRFGISKGTAYRWIEQGQAILALEPADDNSAGQQVSRRETVPSQRAVAREKKDAKVVETTATEVPSKTKGRRLRNGDVEDRMLEADAALHAAEKARLPREGRGDEGEAPSSQGAASEEGIDGETADSTVRQPVALAPDEPTPEPKPDGEGDGVAVGALPQQPDTAPPPPGYGIAKVRPEDFVDVETPGPGVPPPHPYDPGHCGTSEPTPCGLPLRDHLPMPYYERTPPLHGTDPLQETAADRQLRILDAATTLWNAPREELRAALTDSQRRHLAGRLVGTAPEPVSPKPKGKPARELFKPKANGKASKPESTTGCRHPVGRRLGNACGVCGVSVKR